MRGLFLLGLFAVAACANDADLSRPLTPLRIRSQITGRSFTGLLGNQRFFMTFNGNGSATYYGADAQYAHWHATDQGLCIRWYDAPGEACAPVFLVGYASYRVGSITMTEFGLPNRF